MADIYLARTRSDLGAARLLVIKEMKPGLARNERFAEMLVAEAKLAARLTHPNVVAVEHLGREEGALFIAMEYVEGLDLRELLRQCSRRRIALPMAFALGIVCDVLHGLDYAHRRRDERGELLGIVHRDVSPSNVLLSFDGEVKLCDFGIASAASSSAVPTPTIEGKAGYMSPEHARGESLDARADVFGVGVVLWELLSGRRMYKPGAGEQAIELARRGEVPSLQPRGLPLEEQLCAVVARALAVNRGDRYPGAGEFLRELEAYCLETRARLSPVRFGQWLSEHFAAEKLERRRARERVLAALDRGPALVIEPIGMVPDAAEPGAGEEPPSSRPGSGPPSSSRTSEPCSSRPGSDPPSSGPRGEPPSSRDAHNQPSAPAKHSPPPSSLDRGQARVWAVGRRRAREPHPLGTLGRYALVTFLLATAVLWLLRLVVP
jgi:serine/threonine protein kinase